MALIVSGSLIGACGDGEITATQRSSDGEPAPDQLDVDDLAPGVTGMPYVHVTPADVGVTLGVGVVAPVPTKVYTGPKSPAAGATIENVIINHELDINNPNITLRNVILNSSDDFPIQIKGDNATDTLIEYSEINCLTDGKVFDIVDAQRAIIRNNEVTGCQDFFFIEGPLDTLLVENNYMHTLIGDSGAHADGFQIGEFTTTTGLITIRGNYFDIDNDQISKTDLLFATGGSRNNILIENNFIPRWGWYTLRNGGEYSICTIRNNIYSNEFISLLQNQDESPSHAYRHAPDNPAPSGGYSCNRYENGDFIEQEYVSGDTHITTGCPSYPPLPQ
jgi:hypothetical protein